MVCGRTPSSVGMLVYPKFSLISEMRGILLLKAEKGREAYATIDT
jgi:hypothetical protein